MPSRMVLGGRVVWATPDWRLRAPVTKIDPAKAGPIAASADAGVRVGIWTDPDDGITYRVVDKINPLDGWCLAEQLMKHYKIPYKILVRWVLQGAVEPLMEMGSPTKRFRPRDGAYCRQLANEWAEKLKSRKKRIK